jgi:PadR family transcriptional regulator PadR
VPAQPLVRNNCTAETGSARVGEAASAQDARRQPSGQIVRRFKDILPGEFDSSYPERMVTRLDDFTGWNKVTELRVRSGQGYVPVALLTYQVQRKHLRQANTLYRLTIMVTDDKNLRRSPRTLRVLEIFLENPTQELAGTDLQQRGRLASGTLYPLLLRLESAGWFVSRWETAAAGEIARPRRRLYRLTPSGLARASEGFASFGLGVTA